jgi:O-antigen ligase
MRLNRRPLYLDAFVVLATVLVFFAAMTFWRVRDYSDKSVDAQVLFKVLGIGVSLAIPIAAMVAGRLRVTHRVHIAWLLFLGSLMLTSVYANSPQLALLYTAAFIGCFLFAIWLNQLFGETNVAIVLIATIGLIAIISLVVYYVNPELGRMHAWLGDEFGANDRIRGIAASPNGLGSMTAFGLILSMLYFGSASPQQRAIMLAAAPFELACLVMSDNRTGMLMLLIAPVAMAARRGNRAFNLLLLALAGGLSLTVLVLAPDLVFGSVSRTGEAGEVTSGNGRALIWSVVLELIGQQPLFGHGYGSATFILPQDSRLFSVAAHTHNLYLEILFSGGVVALSLFIVALAVTFYDGLRNHCFGPLLIISFFLLRGIFEPAPFGGAPTYAGYVFFIMVAFVAARSVRGRERGHARLSANAKNMLDLCQSNLHQAGDRPLHQTRDGLTQRN